MMGHKCNGSRSPFPACRPLLLQQRDAMPDIVSICLTIKRLEHVAKAVLIDQPAVEHRGRLHLRDEERIMMHAHRMWICNSLIPIYH